MALFISLIFGGVGGVYLALGRKNHDPLYVSAGVALMLYPYFFDSILAILVIGAVIALIPVAHAKGWFER